MDGCEKIEKVVLIGCGNVATHFAAAIQNANIEIVAVCSRHLQNAKHFANRLNIKIATDDLKQIPHSADLYLIAASDDAIQSISSQMPVVEGLVVHTSGGTSMQALANHKRYGVLYPFQTFSKDAELDFSQVPLLIECNNDSDKSNLFAFAKRLTNMVSLATSKQRLALHVAAVLTSNFSNHLMALADNYLLQNGLSIDALHPLMRQTIEKACSMRPFDAQTGPALRRDYNVIQRHIDAIDNPELQNIYKIMTESIINHHSK